MSGIDIFSADTSFETIARRLKSEAHYWWHEGLLWFQRRSDGEQLVIACVFILLLLMLIIRMSMQGKDPGSSGRQFGGSVLMVMMFAFGLGWMLDTGSGSLSFVFN